MNAFVPAPLSDAGRPILQEGEVELKCESEGIHLYAQAGKRTVYELFTDTIRMIMLTNMRLIALVVTSGSVQKMGWAIALASIEFAEDCALGLLRRSTRIRLCVRRPAAAVELAIVRVDIGLGFDREGLGLEDARKNVFLELLSRALQRKSWIAIEERAQEEQRTREIFSGTAGTRSGPATAVCVTSAGVGGIIRNQRSTLKEADILARQATTDMDTLMERAKEAVSMVERFAKYAAEADSGSGAGVGSVASVDEIEGMESILHSIGMVSPVTKFSAGRSYHEQLARQVSEVLMTQDRLLRMGNMITLPDLYCIYNRARGTELVSPDDLKAAVMLMEGLQLGMRLVSFPSGVLVVQSLQLSEGAVCDRLLDLFVNDSFPNCKTEGLQVTDVARLLRLPLVVAKEQLQLAEAHGALCRDESSYGVAFFENQFI